MPNAPAHSYGVLARLPELAAALDRPVLVGPSRKSFMREALGDRPAPERDWGTAAAVTAAVLAGAHIVRVHAVAEMVQVVRVAEEIRAGTADVESDRSTPIAEPMNWLDDVPPAPADRLVGPRSTSSSCRS